VRARGIGDIVPVQDPSRLFCTLTSEKKLGDLFVLQKTIQDRILLPRRGINDEEGLDVDGTKKDELFVPLFFSETNKCPTIGR